MNSNISERRRNTAYAAENNLAYLAKMAAINGEKLMAALQLSLASASGNGEKRQLARQLYSAPDKYRGSISLG